MAKSSTEYARARNYKQITVTFDLDDAEDLALYEFLFNTENKTQLIKNYVRELIDKEAKINSCYGCMGAAFGDCEGCKK